MPEKTNLLRGTYYEMITTNICELSKAEAKKNTEFFSLTDLNVLISDFVDADWEMREAAIIMLHNSAQKSREKAERQKIEQWKADNNIRFIDDCRKKEIP